MSIGIAIMQFESKNKRWAFWAKKTCYYSSVKNYGYRIGGRFSLDKITYPNIFLEGFYKLQSSGCTAFFS